jgi:hypothetical protein
MGEKYLQILKPIQMKSIAKNMRLLIVGAGLALLMAAASGCSNKMGCPGGITQENAQTQVKHI